MFYSFFKTLVGQPVTVELKNDMAITGVLVSVDQFLNIKLENIKVVDEERFPHMVKPYPCTQKGAATTGTTRTTIIPWNRIGMNTQCWGFSLGKKSYG